jgi:hypothetical protein
VKYWEKTGLMAPYTSVLNELGKWLIFVAGFVELG